MSRGQKLVALVLATKEQNQKLESSRNQPDIMSPCSSKQALLMDKLRSVENKFFEPIVSTETHTLFNEGLNGLDLDKTKVSYTKSATPTSPTCGMDIQTTDDGITYDDSDIDPHYIPSDEEISSESNESTSSLNIMAAQLEDNLLQCSGSRKRESRSKKHEITKKRNLGHEYVTKKGKRVSGRSTKPLSATCKLKCATKISVENQTIIFAEYWNLGSYNLRQAFISGMIHILPKKTETKVKSLIGQRNRIYSYNYFVEVGTDRIQVCQKCFLCIFDETAQFIKTIINKKIKCSGIAFPRDQRGVKVPANKISEEMSNKVIEHIQSFPHYESHYTRRHTEQKYLQSDLNLSIMYKLYCAKYEDHVSIAKYSEIFKSLNLKFKKPKLDVCNKCELLQMQIKSTENEEQKFKLLCEKDAHLGDADSAYENKRVDQIYAKENMAVKTYTFDMEQCLPTPYFRTSLSFYKRQLWTFNLTIHDGQLKKAHNMMWHEADGNRGGNEIASCLFQHLLTLPAEITHIILYSDCCAGQNKNSFITAMFQTLIQHLPHLEVIDHKFLVPGHTHMECDTVHGAIERKKKKTTVSIHHPRDWYNFVRSVITNYYVTEMKREQFYNFSNLIKEKFMWRKTNTIGERFLWKDVKWLRYTRKLGHIQYKETLSREVEFKTLNIHRRGINTITRDDLKICYPVPVKINDKKKRDLLDMLPLISQEFHDFYTSLETDVLPDVDPDLIDGSESED